MPVLTSRNAQNLKKAVREKSRSSSGERNEANWVLGELSAGSWKTAASGRPSSRCCGGWEAPFCTSPVGATLAGRSGSSEVSV